MNLRLIAGPSVEPISITDALRHQRIILENAWLDVKHNLDAIADPTADDDIDENYSIGSIWRNTSNDTWFRAADVTADSAVWEPYTIEDMDKDEVLLTHLYIRTARLLAEVFTHRVFINQVWELFFDRFNEREIEIPKPPLKSIDSIQYIDTDGANQTLAAGTDYGVDLGGETGRIVPVEGKCWPCTKDTLNAVKITFTAGYGDVPTDVPEAIRQAIRLSAAELYERREAGITSNTNVGVHPVLINVKHLLYPYQVVRF